MYMGVLPASIYLYCMHAGGHKSQKRESEALESELQGVMSYYVAAWNWTLPWQDRQFS